LWWIVYGSSEKDVKEKGKKKEENTQWVVKLTI